MTRIQRRVRHIPNGGVVVDVGGDFGFEIITILFVVVDELQAIIISLKLQQELCFLVHQVGALKWEDLNGGSHGKACV